MHSVRTTKVYSPNIDVEITKIGKSLEIRTLKKYSEEEIIPKLRISLNDLYEPTYMPRWLKQDSNSSIKKQIYSEVLYLTKETIKWLEYWEKLV